MTTSTTIKRFISLDVSPLSTLVRAQRTAEHTPLYRAEATRRVARPRNGKLSLRIAAALVAVTVGSGLGHGLVASSDSIGDPSIRPAQPVAVRQTSVDVVQRQLAQLQQVSIAGAQAAQ